MLHLLLAALLAAGCDQSGASGSGSRATGIASEQNRPLKVVCTIGMITDVAARIAGPHAQVVGLMGEGVDPHLYKAAPGDIRLLSEANLVFYNGLHLEGKMGDLLVQQARRRPVVQVTEHIDPKLLREPPEFAGQYDPHVWFDVSLWQSAVKRIRDALIELDAPHRADFEKNAAALLAEMDELHGWCKREMATIPAERRLLITAHDAFGYFGRAYGIEVQAIQGISTESEGNLTKINQLVDAIVARNVPAVFFESSVNPKYVESLVEGCRGRGHRVVIGGQLFSDALGKADTPEGTYVGMVRHNVSTIVKALR